MATVALTTDIVKVAIGQLADAGVWLGGKNAVIYNTTFYGEGTESTEYTVNAAATTYPIKFTPTTAVIIGTSSVVRFWFINTDFFRQDTKANGGMTLDMVSSVGTANYYYHGSDTFTGAWEQFVLDTGSTPTVGTNPFTADITVFQISLKMVPLGKNTPTTWADCISYGNVLRASGGTSGDEITIALMEAADAANSYGICIIDPLTDVYKIRGQLDIGDDSNTATTWFELDSQVIVGEALEWIDIDILQINVKGNATGTTQGTITGCFISASDKQMTMDTSDTNITNLTVSGNTFKNIYGISYQSGFVINNNVYNNCFRVDPKASTFDTCTFANCVDSLGAMYWDTTCVANTCAFNNNTLGIHIPATVTGPITFNAMLFDSNTVDVYWAGVAGVLTINAVNGTNISSTNTAGGTITIVSNPVTTEITVKDITTGSIIVGARVLIEVDDNANFPFEVPVTIVGLSTLASVSHNGHGLATGDNIVIRGSTDDEYNGAYQITVVDVDNYQYTASEALPSSAGGLPIATFAFINDVTDALGVVSDTRSVGADQVIVGHVRKSSASPFYQSQPVAGTVTSASGYSSVVQLVSDE